MHYLDLHAKGGGAQINALNAHTRRRLTRSGRAWTGTAIPPARQPRTSDAATKAMPNSLRQTRRSLRPRWKRTLLSWQTRKSNVCLCVCVCACCACACACACGCKDSQSVRGNYYDQKDRTKRSLTSERHFVYNTRPKNQLPYSALRVSRGDGLPMYVIRAIVGWPSCLPNMAGPQYSDHFRTHRIVTLQHPTLIYPNAKY